jgi:hypothetical protein
MEIIESETFNEEESFVFQSVIFYSESKNLIVEKRDVKNKKGKSRSKVNLRNMRPSQISQIHPTTGDSLDDSIRGLEEENAKLKEKIKELEEALMPLPIPASHLAMIRLTTPAAKLKGSAILLRSARGYVEKNILFNKNSWDFILKKGGEDSPRYIRKISGTFVLLPKNCLSVEY